MGAPIKEKLTNDRFEHHPRLFRSISENGFKNCKISKSTQADMPYIKTTGMLIGTQIDAACSTCTIPSHDMNTAVTRINDVETESGVVDCYEHLCCDLADVKGQIQDVISQLGTPQNDMKDTLKKMKGLVNVKEHIDDLKDKIKTLENHLDSEVVKGCHRMLVKDYFSTPHGYRNNEDMNKRSSLTKGTNNTTETLDILGDLLRLRVFPACKLHSVPFSLENYFDGVSRGENTDTSLSMSNEMLRLSSLGSFPRAIDISLFRLARAGFYYTGRSSETKCYVCGAVYKDWTSNDDPMVIHRNISPSCDIVNQDTERSIVGAENRNINSEQSSCNNVVTDRQVLPGDTINKNRLQLHSHSNSASGHDNTASTLNNNSTSHGIEGTSENISITPNIPCEQRNTLSPSNNSQSTRNEPETSASGECNHTEDYSNLGISIEKPRYPNYAPLQVRISSFQGWPSYLDQTPRDMAKAGFLFAGYNDYTRCFFCGGGLRNWEAGDDPWIEHARWFPKCAFLRQNKGDKFINAVLKRKQELEQASATNNEQNSIQANESAASNITQTNKTPNEELSSVAARSVLEMGYTNDQVLNALRKIKQKGSGSSNITATDIMRVLLDDDDSTTFSAASQTSTNVTSAEETSREELPGLSNDDTESLVAENRELRDQRLCKVCLDLDATIAFLPCGHIACCADCAPAMRKCPLCRTFIKGTVKTYLA